MIGRGLFLYFYIKNGVLGNTRKARPMGFYIPLPLQPPTRKSFFPFLVRLVKKKNRKTIRPSFPSLAYLSSHNKSGLFWIYYDRMKDKARKGR